MLNDSPFFDEVMYIRFYLKMFLRGNIEYYLADFQSYALNQAFLCIIRGRFAYRLQFLVHMINMFYLHR